MTLASRVGMHLVWPKMTPSNQWWERDSRKDQIEKRDKALRQLDRQYHLYEALSQLGSPAGKAMYSHMVDGAAIAGRYLERLQQQVH